MRIGSSPENPDFATQHARQNAPNPQLLAKAGGVRLDGLTGSGGVAPGIAPEISIGRAPVGMRKIDGVNGTIILATGAPSGSDEGRTFVGYNTRQVRTPLTDQQRGTNVDLPA